MMLSCDAGTACSLVLLQVSTATAGTKSHGHPTRATPTTSNSTYPTETMATSGQPMRAGRSQAAAAAEVGVVGGGARGGGSGEGVVSTKEVGRDRKRQDNDGNLIVNHTSRVAGSLPMTAGGNGSATSVTSEQCTGGKTTTPSGGQGQAQRGKPQQDKPFSYAQALKTKSSPFSKLPEGSVSRPSSSKLSSRSQTPSESSLLGGGGGKEVIMQGATPHGHGNHTSADDSLDFDLRSSSALSITDSITSERSASRQSLNNLPLDTPSQRADEESEIKLSVDARRERNDSEGDDSINDITFMEPARLEHEQTDIAPVLIPDPSPPTNQFRAPSPVNTTLTVNHPPQPATTEYINKHPGQRSALPTPSQQSSSTEKHEDAVTFVDSEIRPHSPRMLPPAPPPGLSPNKEHLYKSPGTSPQRPSMAGEIDPSQTRVFDSLQQLEQAPPTGLGDDEVDGSVKSRSSQDQATAILMSSSQKPPSSGGKEGVHSLMLPFPGGRSPGQDGVLPNPTAPPIMTSILPHPPTNTQMGFATPPQQTHLPLRPPGESEKLLLMERRAQ